MSLVQKHILSNFTLLDEDSTASLCRICLKNGAIVPIFETNVEDSFDTLTKLSLCLREKIEDIEGYPRFICSICSNILNSAYNFINKYKETCKILESGLEIVKQENEVEFIDNCQSEEEGNIKNEPQHLKNDNDGFTDEDKEFEPLKFKIKLKVKREAKSVKRKKNTSKNYTKQLTNKVASSILEGEFAWNGDEWCLKSSRATKQITEEKSKLLINLKSQSEKKKKLIIEIPKIKKPDPPKLCDLCGEVFKDQDKLSVHKRKVHFRQPMPCPHCSKTLSSKYYLNRHIKRKHVDTKDFICAQCGRGFAFKTELRSHNKSVHEKHLRPKKQYKCKFCSKTYKCAKSIVVHERSAHTGQRPAICSVCSTSFYHDDYLKEHMRLHTGETPFKCPICGRGYAQRCNMKSHLRIHRMSDLDAATLSKLRPNYLRLLKA